MDKKTTSIVCYITFIGWALAYFVGDREGARFHLNQALVIDLMYLVLSFFVARIWILAIPVAACNLVLFVFSLMGIYDAYKDGEKPLPLIGKIQLLK